MQNLLGRTRRAFGFDISSRISDSASFDLFKEQGHTLRSEDLVHNYIASDFGKWSSAAVGLSASDQNVENAFYTEKSFWPAFYKDFASAKSRIIIMSPFASLNRAGKFMDLIRASLARSVDITVYMRPPKEQGSPLCEHAEEITKQLKKLGAKVIWRRRMHHRR